MTKVRRLTETGVSKFKGFLADNYGVRRTGTKGDPPFYLLDSESDSAPLDGNANIESRTFDDRFDLGGYLDDRLAPLGPEADSWNGLWSWIGLYYFDSFCPVDTKILRDHRYWFDADYASFTQRTYRHLAYTPYSLVRNHSGEAGRALLASPVHVSGEATETIMSRQEIRQSRGILQTIDILYYDDATGQVKPRARTRSARGSMDRFQKVIKQFERTYDIMFMDSLDIIGLISGTGSTPSEFDDWVYQSP